jgi:hypothetical protein
MLHNYLRYRPWVLKLFRHFIELHFCPCIAYWCSILLKGWYHNKYYYVPAQPPLRHADAPTVTPMPAHARAITSRHSFKTPALTLTAQSRRPRSFYNAYVLATTTKQFLLRFSHQNNAKILIRTLLILGRRAEYARLGLMVLSLCPEIWYWWQHLRHYYLIFASHLDTFDCYYYVYA